MLNITRSKHGYGDYESDEVRNTIKKDFGRICYLCEGDPVQNWEIDHFYPKEKFPHLINMMDNLFFICSKCNKIRPKNLNELINNKVLNSCVDNVENSISVSMQLSNNANKRIDIVNNDTSNLNVQQTIDLLLNKIYNGINTMSKSYRDLRDDIYTELTIINADIEDYIRKHGTTFDSDWLYWFYQKRLTKPSKYYSFKKSLAQQYGL